MKKTELLSPGGNLNKIKTALLYGADSIYAGTPDMSLRSKSELSLTDLEQVSYITKANNKKLYLTLNLFSHNKDIEKLPAFLETIAKINPDGLLIADPGIFSYFRENMPSMNLHISTQANVCSSLSVDYWKKQGASLCVMARELSFQEIKEVKEDCKDIKIEIFVHGAMCMTYSGRCLLSNYMAERGANQGSCAHSCRWNYKMKARLKNEKMFELDINDENRDLFEFYLEEEFRENEYFPIEEDDFGSYILNSKDLCLMPVLNEYLNIGIDTLKIEGRNKSEYYVAMATKSYRYAIDSWYKDPVNWNYKEYLDELNTLQNRGYTLGFHNNKLTNLAHNYNISNTVSTYMFAGIVMDYIDDHLILEIKNFLASGDVLEFVSPFTIEPIRLRLYEFTDFETGKVQSRISPGKAHQCIKIPLQAFDHEDKSKIKEFLPKHTVVRKENLSNEFALFVKHNVQSFKVENNVANTSGLTSIQNEIDKLGGENSSHKAPKTGLDGCCSKGCNGCLNFWHDDKYAKLREKLNNKKLGEMLIKNIDF